MQPRPLRLATATLMALACSAQSPSLSGTWNLDVGKSSWGKKAQPLSVVVQIDHNEPRFRYTGT